VRETQQAWARKKHRYLRGKLLGKKPLRIRWGYMGGWCQKGF